MSRQLFILLSCGILRLIIRSWSFFSVWAANCRLSLQKRFIVWLGKIKLTDIYSPQQRISKELLAQQKKILPGDIIWHRRMPYASNYLIPGYRKHIYLYLGSWQQWTELFGQKKMQEKPFLDYIQQRFPLLVANMTKDPTAARIIESDKKGVSIRSFLDIHELESIAALRPKLTVGERYDIIVAAIYKQGIPYDFDADMTTDAAMVCSEFIYKVFGHIGYTLGKVSSILGKEIITPTDIFEYFFSKQKNSKPDLGCRFVFCLTYDSNKDKLVYKTKKEVQKLGSARF